MMTKRLNDPGLEIVYTQVLTTDAAASLCSTYPWLHFDRCFASEIYHATI